MRSSLVFLATAAVVYAQSPLIEEYARRYDFWLNPPSNCSNTGCVATECGGGQCQFGKSCGTYAGKKNTCCEARHGGKNLPCDEFEDLLENFNLKSDGEAATLTAPDVACSTDQVFILSNQIERTRSYCCPFGREGVVSVDYGEFLNNLTVESVRCIPAVSGSVESPSKTDGSESPARTSTGATGSSSPNSANTLKSIFALAPIALMAIAAL
ncbi:hypothetical protein TWF730_003324 [Orbilia blumenaviensis]|uniref:Uncharacterized protein n=1 Tax=Orbilia blumenaviensis TaxID=1796055 RepID=A0AAV9U6K7_9PEZI